MQVKKLNVFPVEVIVRGYITGSAWKEYVKQGTVHGMPQPAGLECCAAFPGGPIYTPSPQAPAGEKDMNITPAQARQIVGEKYADKIADLAISIYKVAAEYAEARGIIIADSTSLSSIVTQSSHSAWTRELTGDQPCFVKICFFLIR
jgi:phosphoribosylaminoimidazole-succinocarboxamide synthase